MRNKILLGGGVFIIILLIVGGLVYFGKDKTTSNLPEGATTTEKQVGEPTVLIKEGFTITLPASWTEKTPPLADILLMAIDSQEEISDEKAKEIGFQTNVAVKNDDLGQYEQTYTLAEYIDSVKTSLIQVIPGINFTKEKQNTINGFNAFFMECETTQDEINFGTLLVFIEGKDSFLWAISFNTLQSSWPTYEEKFYQIAESFKLE